jgi:hypothetical protein
MMAQLLRTVRAFPTHDDRLLEACAEELAALCRTVKGVVFVAALEMAVGRVLHSINLTTELDPAALSNAVAQLIRFHSHTKRIERARAPVLDMLVVMGGAHYVLRPLHGRPTVALYLAVQGSAADVAQARIALACAQRAIDANSRP